MALRASLQSYATQASVCRRPSFRALSRFTRPVQLRSVHAMAATGNQKLDKSTSEADWKKLLSAEEYHVIRQKGTEPPGSGKYNKFDSEGTFVCAACQAPLYGSNTKFNSGCGWPAFYDNLPDTVDRHTDVSMGMKRVEITCRNCGGHLGHVFEGEGFKNPTDERHCVNSVSIKFKPKS